MKFKRCFEAPSKKVAIEMFEEGEYQALIRSSTRPRYKIISVEQLKAIRPKTFLIVCEG